MEFAPNSIMTSEDEEPKVKNKLESSSVKDIEKIDDIFSDLLDSVKDAPEVKQEALKILIAQMRQIGEQMRQVRDANNLQELKALMLKHWAELTELTKDNPELFKSIQEWGKKFVDGKKLYYDYINEVKDELIDKSQEISTTWLSIQSELGRISGLIGHDYEIKDILNDLRGGIIEQVMNENGGPIGKLCTSLNETANGYDTEEFDIKSASAILNILSALILRMTEASYRKKSDNDQGGKRVSPIDKHPELVGFLGNLEKKVTDLSSNIKDASKIMKTVKKIRDTHFLDLYNDQAQ